MAKTLLEDKYSMDQERMNKVDDHEAKMAKAELYKSAQYSAKLFKMIDDNEELEGWVQSKITKASDYLSSVYHWMEYNKMAKSAMNDGPQDFEESVHEQIKKQLSEKWTTNYKKTTDGNKD